MLLTIDSSVYLSALIPSETLHSMSQRFLHAVETQQHEVILPALVPLEVVNTFRRRGLTAGKIRDLFVRFYETERINIVALDQEFSAQLVQRRRTWPLKTSDWIIAGTCANFRSQLITWDHQLLRSTKTALHAQTPQSWLRAHA